jgi:hypothetical protein
MELKESTEPHAEADANRSPRPRSTRVALRWGIVALAVLVALIAWLVTREHGSSEPAPREAAPPRIVTPAELGEAEDDLAQPIYWVGPLPGKELELKDLGETGVQVRYLPDGTGAGGGSAKSLTIGSYPLPDPEAALQGYAQRPGSTTSRASDGSQVVTSSRSPSSAYLTDPGNEVQVEVYASSPQDVVNIARSGRLRPAG